MVRLKVGHTVELGLYDVHIKKMLTVDFEFDKKNKTKKQQQCNMYINDQVKKSYVINNPVPKLLFFQI